MRPPISWSALTDASVGVWGLGVEGRPACAACGRWASSPCWSTTIRRAPALDGLRGPGHRRPEGWTPCLAATSWSRARASAATAPRWRSSRRPGSPCAVGSACSWPRPIRARGLHHRHQGEEHHDGDRRAPPDRARLRRPGGREHRAAALGPRRRAGAGLLDHRDVELPGSRSAERPCGGRRHIAVPRPPRLARHGRALLRRQAVAVHQARGDAGPRRRRRRPNCATMPSSSVRTSVGWAAAEVERDAPWSAALGLTGPHNARNASVARAVLEGLGIPGASDEDRLAARGPGVRRAAQPMPLAGLGRHGRVRRRQPLDQRAARPRPRCRPSPTVPWPCSSVGTTAGSTTRRSAGRSPPRTAPTLVVTMPDNGPRIGQAVRDTTDGQVEVRDADEPGRRGRSRVRLGPGRRRGAALAGGAQLRALRRLPGALGGLRRGGRPRWGRSAEQRQQRAPTGASSSRSLRKSHHESAETVAAACTTSRSASNAVERLHRPPGVVHLLGAVHVPEAGALVVEAVVAAQAVALGAPRCRRPGPRRRPPWPSAATGSLDAVVRTTASKAAVEGVAGASGAAPAAAREGLEELHVRLGRAELVGQVRLHELTSAPGRQARRRWPPTSPGAPAQCGGTAPRRRPTRPRRGCRLPSDGRKGGVSK